MFLKPKFWDQKKPNFISYILIPFTIFLKVNNFLLNRKFKKKYKDIKVICIGNIYIGGTGKTSTTIKLYQLLKDEFLNTFTSKKFYSSQMDEQKILSNKTKFITGNSRNEITEKAIKSSCKLLIFDDGLQDKKMNYDLKFVCFDAQYWIGNGNLIPSGPLREKLDSLKKYDAVFLRNNNLNIDQIISEIKKINSNIQIFETKYIIKNLGEFKETKKYLIFSGIGLPDNFKKLLINHKINVVKEFIFPDHYQYKEKDILDIIKQAKHLDAEIITTEKDFIKIPEEYKKRISFLDVNLNIKEEENLINFIKKRINE